jgi:uncharacterized protein
LRRRAVFALRRPAELDMSQVVRIPVWFVGRALALAWLLFGLALPSGFAVAQDIVKVPALTARVTDLTNTLSASDRQALEAKLAAWESQTGNQLVVLMLPSTRPEAIAAYSIRVAEAWKIGHKGKDNGAVFLIAKDDRKNRIEVGYGLEGVLTDVTTRRILAETVAPFFRNGQFAQGIDAGVDQIIAVVNKGEPLADAPSAQPQQRKSGDGIPFDMIFILLFVVVPVIGGILRRIFGRAIGSTVGAGVVGAAAWFFAGSLIIAIIAAILAFIVMITFGMGSGLVGRGGGVFIPGGGGGGFGGGGGSGGGGFSGGGGGFGGGGASGDW